MDKKDDTATGPQSSGPQTITTRLITTAEGQAVLIPPEFAFEGGDQQVTITRSGETITISAPKARTLVEDMFEALKALPPESRFEPIERTQTRETEWDR